MSTPSLVPTNHVLTTDANSAFKWTNALTINTINYSSLVGSTISATSLLANSSQSNTLQTAACQVSTLTTSTLGVGAGSGQYQMDIRGAGYLSSIQAPVDTLAQGLSLAPSVANSSTIIASLTKSVNRVTPVAGTLPFWASGATFGTIAGAPGGYAHVGGVLLPDGRVVFVPTNGTTIGIFNPVTNAYSTVPGVTLPGGATYFGGVLLPDGRVVFVPHKAFTIGIFNPATNVYSAITPSPALSGNNSYLGGVLLPDGRVVFVPANATTIGLFNPVTDTYSVITPSPALPGAGAYAGGVLLPDGRVVFVPDGTTTVGLFNINTPASKSMCLHPFFNKM